MAQVILKHQGRVVYSPGFFDSSLADNYFEKLSRNIEWEHKSIKIFGRLIKEPRLSAWYGDSGVEYKYSGTL